ncbi:ATP-binding protein, partial [Morganella morganii]
IAKKQNTKVLLDFSQTNHLKVAAMLALYAAVEKSIQTGGSYKIVAFSKKNFVNETLKKSGFLILCRNNSATPYFVREYMPVVSSVGGNYRDDIVDFIQQKIYKDKMSAVTESIYGGAVHEAINNVFYHAYPGLELEDKRWWVKCDLVGDQLFLAIYDKGVGIPTTVTKNTWYGNALEKSYPALAQQITDELSKDGISINKFKLNNAFNLVSD